MLPRMGGKPTLLGEAQTDDARAPTYLDIQSDSSQLCRSCSLAYSAPLLGAEIERHVCDWLAGRRNRPPAAVPLSLPITAAATNPHWLVTRAGQTAMHQARHHQLQCPGARMWVAGWLAQPITAELAATHRPSQPLHTLQPAWMQSPTHPTRVGSRRGGGLLLAVTLGGPPWEPHAPQRMMLNAGLHPTAAVGMRGRARTT